MKTPLCRCNNCMTLLVDNNPKDNAALFQVDMSTPDTIMIEEEESYGCPFCQTDGYLSDVGLVINQDYNNEQGVYHILSSLISWCQKGVKDARKLKDDKSKKMFNHFRKQIINEMTEK